VISRRKGTMLNEESANTNDVISCGTSVMMHTLGKVLQAPHYQGQLVRFVLQAWFISCSR